MAIIFVIEKNCSNLNSRKRRENILNRGRFHQTLFAKQNDAGAQRSAKNSPFNFTNNFASIKTLNYMLNFCAPFARSMRQSPNLCAIKSVYFCARAKMVGEIDPRRHPPSPFERHVLFEWPVTVSARACSRAYS